MEVYGACWTHPTVRPDGYVNARYQGRVTYMHIAVYQELVGPVPSGMQLDHLCRNRACYRPNHLEPVTPAENTRRRPSRTHCRRGHQLVPENVYVNTRGQRQCHTCRRAAERQRYLREAA